jgi:hypothetical protein
MLLLLWQQQVILTFKQKIAQYLQSINDDFVQKIAIEGVRISFWWCKV